MSKIGSERPEKVEKARLRPVATWQPRGNQRHVSQPEWLVNGCVSADWSTTRGGVGRVEAAIVGVCGGWEPPLVTRPVRTRSSVADDEGGGGCRRWGPPETAAKLIFYSSGAWWLWVARVDILGLRWLFQKHRSMGFFDTKPMVWVVRHRNAI